MCRVAGPRRAAFTEGQQRGTYQPISTRAKLIMYLFQTFQIFSFLFKLNSFFSKSISRFVPECPWSREKEAPSTAVDVLRELTKDSGVFLSVQWPSQLFETRARWHTLRLPFRRHSLLRSVVVFSSTWSFARECRRNVSQLFWAHRKSTTFYEVLKMWTPRRQRHSGFVQWLLFARRRTSIFPSELVPRKNLTSSPVSFTRRFARRSLASSTATALIWRRGQPFNDTFTF